MVGSVAKVITGTGGGGGGGQMNVIEVIQKNGVNLPINNKVVNVPIPTATSDLTNDSGFITSASVPTKTSDLQNDSGFLTTQVNADWNSVSGASQILNKPTIPAAQVNADWNSASGVSEILNKPALSAVATSGDYTDLSNTPNLANVATSGSYNDLSNKPTIPAAQVNSDWNASSGVAQILNKPTLVTPSTAIGNTIPAEYAIGADTAVSAQSATWASNVALANVQNADDLKAIEALSGTTGLLKKTAANTWTLDTTAYISQLGTPTASASTLAEGSSATASVSATGPESAKVFNFTFGIPKGDTGDPGIYYGTSTPTNPNVEFWIDPSGSPTSGFEVTTNKVTTISSSSTNTEYPSALAVYNYIQSLDGSQVAY